MAINTYATLVTAVDNWLARADLTARTPEFIALAEAKFNRELRVRQMEQRSTATVNTASSEPEFIALPGDFHTMRRVRLSSVTGKPRLGFLSGTQMDEQRYSDSNTSGRPQYFTVFGDEMELLPTPDEAYTIEMVYRKYIPALTSDNTTNWLLTLAPDLYLYGALMEAAPYMHEDERIATWASGVTGALNGLNEMSLDASFNAGPIQIRASGPTP